MKTFVEFVNPSNVATDTQNKAMALSKKAKENNRYSVAIPKKITTHAPSGEREKPVTKPSTGRSVAQKTTSVIRTGSKPINEPKSTITRARQPVNLKPTDENV
jgi:hypothetical protein